MKLLIVDGSNIATRAYYAGNPFSFFSMVNKAVKAVEADRIVYVFDSGEKGWRHELYPAYKADRKEKPDELILYLNRVVQYLVEAGAAVFQGPEGDDIIASLVAELPYQMKTGEYKIFILSSDTDLYAIFAQDATVINVIKPPNMNLINFKDVKNELGIWPSQVAEFKALVGGHDNIPGCPLVGAKSAAILLSEFMSINNMYEHIEDVTILPLRRTEDIKKSLIEHKKQVELSLHLSTLDDTVSGISVTSLDLDSWLILAPITEHYIVSNLRAEVMNTDNFPLLRKSILEAEEEWQ
jgi:DNA polymerase-1